MRAAYPFRRFAVGIGMLCAAALVVSTGVAAAADAPLTSRFELTPFVGYRLGGRFRLIDTDRHVDLDDHLSAAFAVDLRAERGAQYEIFYGRQGTVLHGAGLVATGVRVEYLHVGGTIGLDDASSYLYPYLAAGVGVTRMSPDASEGRDDTRFSASLALGMRVPVSDRWAMRLEGRGFVTPVNTSTAFFCRSDQSGALCRVQAHGSTFFQFDLLLGATYMFPAH